MLDHVSEALAAAGGAAVVAAVGADAWVEMRPTVARWAGRGDARREQAELDRLDETAAILRDADADADADADSDADTEGRGRVRRRQEMYWRRRIEAVLESLRAAERVAAADELRELLARHARYAHHAPSGSVRAGSGGLAVGGDVVIRAEGGAVAAGMVQGIAGLSRPRTPVQHQG